MSLYTYDPAKVIVNVAGANLEGYADGTFINAERSSDTFTKSTGSDGRTTRVKQNDKSGTITITLQQSSPSNNILSSIMVLDEASNEGIVPIAIKDILGTTAIASGYCWVKKPPAVGFAKDAGNREWLFDCAVLEIFVGGALSFQG